MDIKDVILGFLDWQPMTGYDLKKVFGELEFLPWSGNNNQIYTALSALARDGFVSKTVIHQENLPAQKRYAITSAGREHLQFSIIQPPEVAGVSVRSSFLLQLCWSYSLSRDELNQMIGLYQIQLEKAIKACQLSVSQQQPKVSRTRREGFVWSMVARHRMLHLQSELNWLELLKGGLDRLDSSGNIR